MLTATTHIQEIRISRAHYPHDTNFVSGWRDTMECSASWSRYAKTHNTFQIPIEETRGHSAAVPMKAFFTAAVTRAVDGSLIRVLRFEFLACRHLSANLSSNASQRFVNSPGSLPDGFGDISFPLHHTTVIGNFSFKLCKNAWWWAQQWSTSWVSVAGRWVIN